ncbi:putative HTH-type transcriptional regulator [Fretibacterium fastidiosum]|uniref:Predicted transcriptional regulators n=2 Tax=Fretibacterium fastidiosum TaxID=651822 RepID=A0AB94IZ42_9BACT|nr:Predicted transcriptional regulators [Fretibacterium fastidiosum]
MVYTMTQACEETGMTYQGLKFYCNEGLVPNVKRDGRNRRVFDERDLAWIKGLSCLRDCDMSIKEMKRYLELCLQGVSSIPERKNLLEQKRRRLVERMAALENSIQYIDAKQRFYDEVLSGKRAYVSNLVPAGEP